MNLHGNARTCPRSRRLLVERVVDEGWALVAAAEAAGVSARTASKWVARFRAEGVLGFVDRSSRPHCSPRATAPERVEAIAILRRLRFTAAEISQTLGMPLSTVSAVLSRIGLGKLSRLEPVEPTNRYQRRHPGELVHIDIKKLAKIDGAGHRVHGERSRQKRRRARHGSGTSTCMCASTTPPAWPTPKCSRTRRRAPPSAFYVGHGSGIAATACASSA
jgi:transposase